MNLLSFHERLQLDKQRQLQRRLKICQNVKSVVRHFLGIEFIYAGSTSVSSSLVKKLMRPPGTDEQQFERSVEVPSAAAEKLSTSFYERYLKSGTIHT